MTTITESEMNKLREYSCSLPTGTTIGKRWKRNDNFLVPGKDPDWFIGEYIACDEPDRVGIKWTDVIIVPDQ